MRKVLVFVVLIILLFVVAYILGFGVFDSQPKVSATISCEDGSPVQSVVVQPFPGQTKMNTDNTTVFVTVPVSKQEDKIITFLVKCQDHVSSIKIDAANELSLIITCNAQECVSRLSN